jgi:hypothetical protein
MYVERERERERETERDTHTYIHRERERERERETERYLKRSAHLILLKRGLIHFNKTLHAPHPPLPRIFRERTRVRG